jgi:hypothetical protein
MLERADVAKPKDPQQLDLRLELDKPEQLDLQMVGPACRRNDRLTVDHRGYRALIIGQGQESLVVRYLDGPDAGLV